ncbi:MAG TPA: type VI secretion system baseplate subunit TssG [Candidatus Acidoferrum sp.]|nr:type VI secretion system baseplate subunit TssG [Candidatus Acidoferrum sp.]
MIAELAAKPFEFDFFAAMRLIQCGFSNQPRIGYSWSPAQDPVRFCQSPALDFAPATLEALRPSSPTGPLCLYSRHFGLFGPNGPLPLCLTEYGRDRIVHHGDTTFAAFCNVFHHRLLSFFFRSWADAQKHIDLDRPDDQRWTHFVRCLIGLGMDSMVERDTVPDRAKLFFAGRLVHQNRNAEGLESIVEDFFGIRTEVCAFVGRWLKLPPSSLCRLGASAKTGTLGVTLVVGTRFWTCQLHFRLRMGPMSLADYERLLPSGGAFGRLCDWVRQYAGEHFSWDVNLILDKEEVPRIQLARAGRLGWTTWLKSKPFENHAEDLILAAST